MVSAGISWRGKAVVLCSTWLDSGELRDLSAHGASVGSISPIPGFDDHVIWWRATRSPSASQKAWWSIATVASWPSSALKPFYLAALTCTGSLLFALLRVAFESLHHSGIPPGLSATLLERQITRTLRSFLKGGRRAYPGRANSPDNYARSARPRPELGHYFEQAAAWHRG